MTNRIHKGKVTGTNHSVRSRPDSQALALSQKKESNYDRHHSRGLVSSHRTNLAIEALHLDRRGTGGAPVDEALVAITTDLMHICHRAGLSWEELAARSQQLCEREEADLRPTSHAA